jgi:type IV secretory pathway ATPase VirB11/archaellum biosynthesis ATPase
MFTVVITEKGGKKQRLEFDEESVVIGRVTGNHVVLPRGNVSQQHCKIEHKGAEFKISDLGSTNGTYVNGRKISSPVSIAAGDKIYVGEFILGIEYDPVSQVAKIPAPPAVHVPPPKPKLKPALPRKSELPRPLPKIDGRESSISMPAPPKPGIPRPPAAPPKTHSTPVKPMDSIKTDDHLEHLMDFVALQVKHVERQQMPCLVDQKSAGEVKVALRELVDELITKKKISSKAQGDEIIFKAFLSIVDLGILNSLLLDESISEIEIADPYNIKVLKNNRWTAAETTFENEDDLLNALNCLTAALWGGVENGINGLLSFKTSNGYIVLVQSSLEFPVPSAKIYKNTLLKPETDPEQIFNPATLKILTTAIADKKRIAVAGSDALVRLNVISAIAGLLPEDETVVSVEEFPFIKFRSDSNIELNFGHKKEGAQKTESIEALLKRAVDLNPAWVIARPSEKKDILNLFSFSAMKSGFLFELPLAGRLPLNEELTLALLPSGLALQKDAAARFLTRAVDITVIAGRDSDGLTQISSIY